MKLSIITPSYNSYPLIKRCIGSVRNQVAPDLVVEHTIMDGASKDETPAFLRTFDAQAQDPNNKNYSFSYLSENDSGMYDAINKSWQKATGNVISWITGQRLARGYPGE